MASLSELAKIEDDSLADDPGDPGDPPDPNIVAVILARDLRARIRILLARKGYNFIEGGGAGAPANQTEIERIAFAQQLLRNTRAYLDSAFLIVLVQAPPAHTPPQILAVTDTQLDLVLTPARLDRLAYGLRPGAGTR